MAAKSTTADPVQYFYAYQDAHGIKWNDIVTSYWIVENEALFNGLLQYRPATDKEIQEHVKRNINKL
jgi:hypothetical protein